jgi:hypothetical protein
MEKMKIIDLPGSSLQIHLHEGAGSIKPYGWQRGDPYRPLDAYESAMADHYASQLGLTSLEPMVQPKLGS